ncbi:DELTA-sagatoxin-Srs1a-like [Anabas testudineus]|uniref:Uncharacterized protein n=1 Tax=Anabas testudineus TaxID=64144 RepID=A0A3Q1JL70_ANATE|nr:DELTA-sagatoxin-Srs1a-like [Anabas testudineus]
MGHRQSTIELKNDCSDYKLINPSCYTYSGSCSTPFPAEIGPFDSGIAVFEKTAGTSCGSVGVVTYDLLNKSTQEKPGKLAIMFSNPFNFNFFSNLFAVGVFNMSTKCDYDLYRKMYYEADGGYVRGAARDGGLTYTSERVTITATMTDTHEPVIRIQVRQK